MPLAVMLAVLWAEKLLLVLFGDPFGSTGNGKSRVPEVAGFETRASIREKQQDRLSRVL